MKTRFTFLSVLLALLVSTGAYAQCDMSGEDGQWPTSTIVVDAGGAVTNISTVQYAGSEYSVVGGIVSGRSYEFTHAAGSYITVRVGSVAGTVLGAGFSPLTVVANASSNLYVHWTVDAACTVDGTGSFLTTVQDVTPPCDMSGEDGQWPTSAITVDAGGAVTNISTNQYAGSEYSVVTGMVGGDYYEVTHANGSYITVREGSIAGTVVAEGFSPLQFTAASSSDIYIHWTADASCTVNGTGSFLTTIQNLGSAPCDMSGEDGQWPTSAVTVDAGGALTNISTAQYAGSEYSVITGIQTGRSYEFTHANGSFITVRSGTVAGAVVGSGYSPLTVIAPSADNLFVHWTADDLCTVDGTGSFLTTVQDVTQPCDMSGEDGQWPTSTITVDAGGAVTGISSSQYAGSEYSVVTGIVAGNYYNVTHAAGSYITVREGAVAGPVVASGYSPLGFEALSSADVYIHWTSDASCSVDGTGSFATTIQNLGLPPCDMSGEDGQWPTSAVTVDAGGALTTISTVQYVGSEYSVITGIASGNQYEFTHAAGSYITVRVGSVTGTVLGSGYSPLTVVATSTSNLYVHWTADDACTVDGTGSHLTTVQNLGIPPCDMSAEDGQWPTSAITPDIAGAVTTISTIQYVGSEYSVITGIYDASQYEFTHAAGSYITVREGAVDGPVLGAGYSPLTVTTTSTSDLYVHWTADDACSVDGTGSHLTTVQNLTPPCLADAGTSTEDASPVCLSNGSATISVTADGNQVIPSGYQVTAVLADGSGNVLDAGALSFTVNAVGDYYVHIAVIDPADFTAYQAASTVAGLHALTIDGGGSLCGSIDLTGTLITVEESPVASFTYAQVNGTLQVDFTNTSTGTAPLTYSWDFGDLAGTSTDVDPSYTYASDGSYSVVLLATNSCGSDDETISVMVAAPISPCISSADTWSDLNSAGGAPCFDGSNCVPTDANFTSFGIYGSETYLLDNVEAGFDYVFDMCTGVGAGSWIPEITIVAADGTTVDSWNGEAATGSSLTFLDQCSLEWTASQSGTYYIVINEMGTAAGDAPSQVDCGTSLAVDNGNPTVTCGTNAAICPLPPANDECQGAVALTVNSTCVTIEGDVTGATESLVGCAGTANDDVWFSFQTTGPEATIEVTGGAGFDAVFEVFEGACGSLNSLQCVDATGDGGLETVDLSGLTVGNIYYVRVHHYYGTNPSPFTFDICVHSLSIGIENVLEAGLSVYPNPSNGEFILEVTGIEADAQIVVNDLAGRQIFSEGVTMGKTFRKEISLDVATGTYLLQVVTVDGTVTRRVQVN